MATELDGKPLKFTAVFDSKEADQSLDAWLKKIKDVNTKGANGAVGKTVGKSSSQYKSILADATQSFEDFTKSNTDFYSALAKSEMGLQKIRIEQNMLNGELRKGLITEDEYISKTSQLTQMRQKLSEELKNNKAQLQQYNSVINAKQPYTKSDTLNELKNAHKSGGGGEWLTPSESFNKVFQENLSKVNKELSDLDKKLQEGKVTNEQYAESAAKINARMLELQQDKKYFDENVGKPLASDGLNQQKNVLDAVSSQYKEVVINANEAFEAMSSSSKKLYTDLASLRQESASLSDAQKDLSNAYKRGDITQSQYLESTKNLAVQQDAVKGRISQTQKDIRQLDASEARAITSIAEKTAKLTQLKVTYDKLSDTQRDNINVGGKIRKEYRDLSAEVEKLNKGLTGVSSHWASSAIGAARGVAGALGIAFGTQQLVSFGMEIFELTKKIEGVSLAFARIGEGQAGLDKLRKATANTVDDLKLMTLAVEASNFSIPMDVLAKGLEFASKRAQDTGKSVDYLVDSFVTGLGRKSTMILDNLGISIIAIQEEVRKVGDFNIAVGNIIEREMARSGAAVDTLGSKVGRLTTLWQNFKQGLASFLANVSGELDTKRVTQLIEEGTNAIKGFDKESAESRRKTIQNKELEIKAIRDQIKASETLRAEMVKPGYRRGGEENLEKQLRLEKSLKEKLYAENAILSKINDQNKALDTKERISKGIVSDAELEAQIAEKRQQANQWVVKDNKDLAYKNKLLKEADALEKLLSQRNGKADKKTGSKLENERKRNEEGRINLLDKWAKTDAEYLTKALDKDRQEVESVKSKYAEIKKEIEKFNKETKGKKISLDGLADSQLKSISTVLENQANDRKLKQYQDDYSNYLKYEQLKKEAGDSFADEQYGKYAEVVQKMKGEYAGLATRKQITGLSGADEKYFKELESRLKSNEDRENEERNSRLIEALKLSETFSKKEQAIRKKYSVAFAELEKGKTKISEKEYEERRNILIRSQQDDLKSLIESNPEYEKAMKDINESSKWLLAEAFKTGKKAIDRIIDGMDVTPQQKAELKKVYSEIFDKGASAASAGEIEEIEGLINGFDQLLNQASQFDGTMSNALRTISSMVSQVAKVTQSLGKGLQKAGASLGVFGAVLGVLGTVTEIGENWNNKKQQEYLDKTNYAYEAQIKQLQGITSILEYQLSLIDDMYGLERAKSYEKIRQDAIKSLKESAAVFDGSDFDAFNPKSDKNHLTLLRGRMDGKKYQLTGISEYDAIIEGINKGQDVMKTLGDTPSKLKALLANYEKMIKDGLLIPVEMGFKDVTKITAEEIQRLNELVRSNKLDEATKEQVQNVIDQYEILKEATNKLREEILGTSFNNIFDSAKNLFFNNGENSADAWTKGFGNIMEDYLKNLFNREFLETAVQEFYELYDSLAKGGLTSDEKKILEEKWNQIEKEGKDRLQGMENDLGISLGTSNSQSELSKGIQGMSEKQADRLEAEFGGLRLGQLALLEVTKSNHLACIQSANARLAQLVAIQNNTFRTANNTDRLLNIEIAIVELNKKVVNGDAIRRGAGL